LATHLSSVYNTEVGTPTFSPGINLFVGRLPDDPARAVALLLSSTLKNPHEVINKPEFELVTRDSKGREGYCFSTHKRMYDILKGAGNPVSECKGLIRPLEELAGSGYDKQERPLYISRFVFWAGELV